MTKLLIRWFVKDNSLEKEEIRERYGTMSGIVGAIVNVLVFAIKLFIGIISKSVSITADAVSNLGDAGSSVITFAGFKLSARPADRKHPFGYGRIEYISGLIVSVLIIIMGFEFIQSSIERIIEPTPLHFDMMSTVVLTIAVLIKLWMFFFNKKISNIINSATIKAMAFDSIADVVVTITVIISMGFSYLIGFNIDGYTGILVSLFIMYTGVHVAKSTLSPLLGQASDPDLAKKIKERVLSYDPIVGVHDIVIHNYGPNKSIISLHAEVPYNINILDLHSKIYEIEVELSEEFAGDVVIRMDPIITDDETINSIKREIRKFIDTIDKTIEFHDFRMIKGKNYSNIIFEVVVPHGFKLTDKQLIKMLQDKISQIDSQYKSNIAVYKSFIGYE